MIKDHPVATTIKTFPSFNFQEYLNRDKENAKKGLDLPLRFGKAFETNCSLSDGEWITLSNGRLWSMKFRSSGAYSINFIFENLYLPESSWLYIINSEGTMLYGPVTSKQNTNCELFLTDLIKGDEVTIYLFESNSEQGQSKLSIKRVVHAYRDFYSGMSLNILGTSESCENDVACFPNWDEESDAVVLVLLSSGIEWCTGALIMSANQSFKPYFLSAFHCIDVGDPALQWPQDEDERDGILQDYEITNAENWMFKFQFKKATCGGTNATRLSNWLNPNNSGITTINTARPPSISGSTLVCSSGSSFTINNLPTGATIVWNQGPKLTVSVRPDASCFEHQLEIILGLKQVS